MVQVIYYQAVISPSFPEKQNDMPAIFMIKTVCKIVPTTPYHYKNNLKRETEVDIY